MKLTARQIKYIDELGIDKTAVNATAEMALRYHSNRMNEIYKKEKELWDELREIHGLDESKVYSVKTVDGAVCIVEKSDD